MTRILYTTTCYRRRANSGVSQLTTRIVTRILSTEHTFRVATLIAQTTEMTNDDFGMYLSD